MQEITEGMGSICIEETSVDHVSTSKARKPRLYRLLILDLNGILICRRYEKNRDLEPPEGAYREGNFFVWLRPGLESFLEYIFDHFEVAVWSSVMKHNIHPLAKEVFRKYYDQLVFVADQSYCQKLDNPEIDVKTGKPSAKPLFRKNLDKVWAFSDLKGRYNEKNTLIVDDSDDKMINNPKECHFNPGTWSADKPQGDITADWVQIQSGLLPTGYIRKRLEKYVADTQDYCEALQNKYSRSHQQ